MKKKLIDSYGDELIVTDVPGEQTVYMFLDTSDRILHQTYHDSGLSKEDIMEKCSMIISDDISSKVYDLSKHPTFSNMSSGDLVPELLGRWMKGVVKSKSFAVDITKSFDRKRSAISSYHPYS